MGKFKFTLEEFYKRRPAWPPPKVKPPKERRTVFFPCVPAKRGKNSFFPLTKEEKLLKRTRALWEEVLAFNAILEEELLQGLKEMWGPKVKREVDPLVTAIRRAQRAHAKEQKEKRLLTDSSKVV